METQFTNVFSLAGKHFLQRPFDSLDGGVNCFRKFLPFRDRSSSSNHLQRVADVVIHLSNHFQLPDNVVSLAVFIEEDE